MLSLDGTPPARHPPLASNTAWDISNSAFEGSLYGTSMQSLTLAIWGACRTPLKGQASTP